MDEDFLVAPAALEVAFKKKNDSPALQTLTLGNSPAFRKVLDEKGIPPPAFFFSHLILRVNCTFSCKPLKGLITGNLNLSLEMVMQIETI